MFMVSVIDLCFKDYHWIVYSRIFVCMVTILAMTLWTAYVSILHLIHPQTIVGVNGDTYTEVECLI